MEFWFNIFSKRGVILILMKTELMSLAISLEQLLNENK